MSWSRSKSNAQELREMKRRRELLRRAVDARVSELAAGCRAGAR